MTVRHIRELCPRADLAELATVSKRAAELLAETPIKAAYGIWDHGKQMLIGAIVCQWRGDDACWINKIDCLGADPSIQADLIRHLQSLVAVRGCRLFSLVRPEETDGLRSFGFRAWKLYRQTNSTTGQATPEAWCMMWEPRKVES